MTAKPYLRALDPSPECVTTALDWAHYLGTTYGTGGALNALQYYDRIGWITTEVRREMIRYVQGLSLGEIHNKKYDEPGTLNGPLENLSGTSFGAHARSLQFIAEIAGVDLEGEVMRGRLAEHTVAQGGWNGDLASPPTVE